MNKVKRYTQCKNKERKCRWRFSKNIIYDYLRGACYFDSTQTKDCEKQSSKPRVQVMKETINFLLEIKKDELADRHRLEDYAGCLKLQYEIGILEYLTISDKNNNPNSQGV